MVQFVQHGAAPQRNSTEKFAERFLGGYENARSRQHELEKLAEQASTQKQLKQLEMLQQLQRDEQSHKRKLELQEKEFGLKEQLEEGKLQRKQDFLQKILGNKRTSSIQEPKQRPQEGLPQEKESSDSSFDPSSISDEDILSIAAVDPTLGNLLAKQKDVERRERTEREKTENKRFDAERNYQLKFGQDLAKKTESLRESIPKKEAALSFARNAVETGNEGFFSLDKLADATGIDLFRTAKGAQLLTAGKENLLSNMGRVSARGQNLWFEMRLNSMFPKIGQSKEANLTVQEMIEGEVAMDKAYLNELDKISEQDRSSNGFVNYETLSQRARAGIKPQEKQILNRTSYRMKEVEEQEKGLKKLKSEVGKNVPKGTPLTLAMAKLYIDKFKDPKTALEVAKKNGYHIPTPEEFKRYRESQSPSFEEELND